jgi:hypothetical protein
MLDVVFWKWKPRGGYRSHFSAQHVNIAASMVRRHYSGQHRINCITDDASGIDKSIRIIPLWSDYRNLRNPSFTSGPSCYCRLKAFSKEAKDIIGERFVSLDLDFVATGDLAPLWDRDDDFIVWGDTFLKQDNNLPGYNGSMWMMTAGSRSQVWERFDPLKSPQEANRAGRKGSDQGWITYVLGKGEKMWTTEDGVYSWRKHLRNSKVLPENARIVFFHGVPWNSLPPQIAWVQQNYK